MAKKNFMAYGDAETIFTEYAGALNRKLNCFSGTREEFLALSEAERKKFEYILDPTSDVVVYAVMDEVDDVELTFTNDVATVSIPGITAKSKVWVFYSDASYDVAKAADITVTSGSGVVTFTAANTPTDTITCDILYYLKKDTTNFASVVGGGGHVIEDAYGTELPQEDKLQFAGYLRTSDDSTNGKTVVTDAPEEVTWAVWQTMTDEQKTGHHWLITDAPTGADSVRYFTLSSSSWAANTDSDATEFPYVYTIASTAYGADFVPAEVLLLGSSSGDYPSSSEEEDIALVDKYIKFSATAIRLRATDTPTNNLTLVIRDGSSSGASSGGLLPRLLITSTVAPTITKPGGDTAAATHISGNNYYYDAPEWGTYTVTRTVSGSSESISVFVNTCKIYVIADKTTFEGIQLILDSHLEEEMLDIGDEINITLQNNETMTYQIGAINHDYPHQVIFVPKWCLATKRSMNGSGTNAGGWNGCAMRTWLNEDFFSTILPSDVASLVKTRDFKVSKGNQSSELQTASDKIWLPREYEIFGQTTYAASSEHDSGGAKQFDIFGSTANRIKTMGESGSADTWWSSSPGTATSTSFIQINSSGSDTYSYYANSNFGVLPCFHMLADN